MKITKKIIPFVLAGFLGMVVTACANPNTSSVGPSSSTSDTPITKQDPTITIGLVEGEQYEVDGFRTPTITITPETLTHTVTYYKGGTSVGSEAPTEAGDYTITVTTTETAEYNAGSLSKSFLLRHIPTLTFYYGDDVPLADGHQFRVGEELNIYAKSSVETAVITYTYSDATGATLDAAPEEEGVYFLNASVARTDTIGSGVRNLYKYTPIYSDGGKPELIEDDVFRITIPLDKVAADEGREQKTLSEREQKIYNMICENLHLSVEQVMAELDISRATVFRDYAKIKKVTGAMYDKKTSTWTLD